MSGKGRPRKVLHPWKKTLPQKQPTSKKVHLEIEVLHGTDKYIGVGCGMRHPIEALLRSKQAKEITCKECGYLALVISGHQNDELRAEWESRVLRETKDPQFN